MDIGLGLAGDPVATARAAAAVESPGVESVWVAELDRSSTVGAAAAIGATTRINVGTALAFARSPTFAAMEVLDLADLSGGRFLLGLGTQVKKVMEARFSVESPQAKIHRGDVIDDFLHISRYALAMSFQLEGKHVIERALRPFDLRAVHRLLTHVHGHEQSGSGSVRPTPSSRPMAMSALESRTKIAAASIGESGGSGAGTNAEYPAGCRT